MIQHASMIQFHTNKMKLFIAAIAMWGAFELSAVEQKRTDDKYCAKLIDGKLIVVNNGEQLTNDVKLADGTILHPDGNMVKPDGTSSMLKDGECIRKDAIPDDKKDKPGKKRSVK